MSKLKNNPDVTDKAAQNGIYYWQIALELGVYDSTFSRWMRKPLKPELKIRIFEIIDKLSQKAN